MTSLNSLIKTMKAQFYEPNGIRMFLLASLSEDEEKIVSRFWNSYSKSYISFMKIENSDMYASETNCNMLPISEILQKLLGHSNFILLKSPFIVPN